MVPSRFSLPVVPSLAQVQADFLAAKPRLVRHGRCYFRHVRCHDRKADLIQEMLGLCWKWWLRLIEVGKNPKAFVTTLATFAAKAVRCGRRVCGQLKAKDVLSERAQLLHNFNVDSLPISTRTDQEHLYSFGGQRRLDEFEERLQDNTVTPVPDQVQFRLDWPSWLKTRCQRDRQIIKDMGRNERTQDIAAKYHLSQARISQLRREFHDDWQRFTDEAASA